MAGFSKYPEQIDDSSSLPVSTDNVTPVKAEVVNRLRDAILAMEAELGIDPSREFGTVRARLDAMESGSGGGGGAIEILQDGVEILPSAISLDFIGNVSITVPSPLRAQIEIIGGQATQIQENTTPVFNGQTLFSLSQTPVQNVGVMMFINGIKQTIGVDYTVSGTVITYSGLASKTSDKIEFWYLVDMGSLVVTSPSGLASGDLAGTYPNPTVARMTAAVTNVSAASYDVLVTDYLIAADSTGNTISINLPIGPSVGKSFEIKDVSGTSGSFNITVNGNGNNIDGSPNYILDVYECITVRFTGSQWSIV